MSSENEVMRVPFGEVARLAEKAPRKNKPKTRHKNTDGKNNRQAKEASMSQSNVPDTMMNKSTPEQTKALEKSSAFSDSMSKHGSEFATAFSVAAGAAAGVLVVIGVAALVQKGVNAAFGGGTDETPIDPA